MAKKGVQGRNRLFLFLAYSSELYHCGALAADRTDGSRDAGRFCSTSTISRGADKSLARPGRTQATATKDFDFHIAYL